MTPNGQPATQVPQPLQISSWTTTVPYSVRYKAPVGHTSKHPAKVQCLHTSELISHRNSGVSGFGGLSTFSLMRVPGEPNSGIPIYLALSFCRVSGSLIEGMPRRTSFCPESRAVSICCSSCSMNATCRQVFAARPPVLSYEDSKSSRLPSMGTWFHSLQATSQALQPIQMEVSVQ